MDNESKQVDKQYPLITNGRGSGWTGYVTKGHSWEIVGILVVVKEDNCVHQDHKCEHCCLINLNYNTFKT